MKTYTTRLPRLMAPVLLAMMIVAPPAAWAQTPLAGSEAQMRHGAYLATIGDCAACHTAHRAQPFAGGLPIQTPFGAIFSTNITPDATTGIGAYTYDDFARALRDGIARDGHRLYPAMPYPSYAKIDDADMHALYRYFLSGVKPLERQNQPTALRFPFSIRTLMAGWDQLYAPKGSYRPDPRQSVEWNRGAYLVEGLGHCSACHTPHGRFGQETAFDNTGNDVFLSGYSLAGWYAPNLRGHPVEGGGAWNKQDLVAYLRSGRLHDSAAFGPMTEVIENSTQYLHDDDLNAIATYLTSPPLQSGGVAPQAAGPDPAKRADRAGDKPASGLPEDATASALRAGHIGSGGAGVYLNNCSACHRSDGTGAMPAFPGLNGNAAVNSADPTSLIRIVLSGSRMPSTAAAPTPLAMPEFGWRLSDAQVADLLTFIRSSWGNQAPAVTADQVAKVRETAMSAR